jgi:hypothetical protein
VLRCCSRCGGRRCRWRWRAIFGECLRGQSGSRRAGAFAATTAATATSTAALLFSVDALRCVAICGGAAKSFGLRFAFGGII